MTDTEKLEELKASEQLFILPADAAKVLGCAPELIRVTAKQCPERLGFPVAVIGTRTRIPRLPFIQFVEGKA